MFKIRQTLNPCYFMCEGSIIKLARGRCQWRQLDASAIERAVGVTDITVCKNRGADVPGCVWVWWKAYEFACCTGAMSSQALCDTTRYQTGLERRNNRLLLCSTRSLCKFLIYIRQVTALLPPTATSFHKLVSSQICTVISSPATYSGRNSSMELFTVRKERNTVFYRCL